MLATHGKVGLCMVNSYVNNIKNTALYELRMDGI